MTLSYHSPSNSDPAFIQEAEQLMQRLDPEPGHAEQVKRLALQLFDVLQPIHQLPPSARIILEASALLHDIGWSVPGGKHHKQSAKLIEKNNWQHASHSQILQVAAIARYHRKAHPSLSHQPYSQLDPENRKTVSRLASILRIADGLDRSHLNRVYDIRAKFNKNRCVLLIFSKDLCSTEIWGAQRKSRLFEETFGLELEFRPRVRYRDFIK